ncbi:DUF2844 domain-containing protein [Paraburkholderia sp. EG287A]|uniref:DUF2844 domain-containing protein n=1 Tax=Paraburkholderia sp. EG287A TaxID=3237012 RepID=UPI0034D18562
MKKTYRMATFAAAAGLFATSMAAHAALGSLPLTGGQSGVSSVSGLHAALAPRTSADTSAATGYTVNTVTLDSGTVVKEFVSTSTSKVFAVIWHGPAMPNLQLILGDSFTSYANATDSASGFRSGSLSSRSVSVNGLVVQTNGSPGHFHGFAYIAADFPTGVTLDTLRQKQ